MAMAGADTKKKQGQDTKELTSSLNLTLEAGLSFDVLVETLGAVNVENPKQNVVKGDPKTLPAYEVTLKAVLPERQATALMSLVRNHRVRVRIEPHGDDPLA